ncbi:MAG: ACT domain-containing protein [Isosphaeraceae bacterium]
MNHYIVTVTAADRIGIVYSVSGTLRDEGAHIVELSQTVMRGFFTIILDVTFPNRRDPKALAEQIRERGKRFDMTVAVIDAGPATAAPPPVANGERFILTVLGDDAAGNVHGISGCLAAHGVNIVDLHARVDGARFALVMEAFLPPDLSPATVRAELERFGRDHGLEAYVQHEDIFVATSEPSPVRVGPGLAQRSKGDAVVPH